MSLLSPSLEAFWVVANKGTVLEASKNLNLTQTGVTQRIRTLEKQLGVTLFLRSRTGMRLTPEGESLFAFVRQSEDLQKDLLKSFVHGVSSKTIKIKIGIAKEIYNHFSQKIATVSLGLNESLSFHQFQEEFSPAIMRKQHYDMMIVPTNKKSKELDFASLGRFKFILIGKNQSKSESGTYFQEQGTSFKELRAEECFRKELKNYKRSETDQNAFLLGVKQSQIALVVSEVDYQIIFKKMGFVKLSNKSFEVQYGLVFEKQKYQPLYLTKIIESICR